METRRSAAALPHWIGAARWGRETPLPAAVYRELVASLFTMRLPIVGFGLLYVLVSTLVFLRWPDPFILGLTVCAALVTMIRFGILIGYQQAGGASQPIDGIKLWERRYTAGALAFAMLLSALNIRVLTVHEPLFHIGTVSLVFTFGAGVVSRTSYRPQVCVWSLLIAVVPTALAMLLHATSSDGQPFHSAFFVLFALLLLAVLTMSLESVRHLHAAAVEHLITKHDLAKLARHDALTGLPNRVTLRDAFRARLDSAQRTGAKVAMHYLDLDGFKAVNDGYGHPVGDQLLKVVAARLLATVRSEDVASRLGGDEFLLIQGEVQHQDEAELLARRVVKHLSDPYVIDGMTLRISVSVGITLAPADGAEFDELVASADAALYRAKAFGKSQLQFYATDDRARPARSVA